jgi:NADH:ubiquinone oxidoreductase subunit 5 (subunit L)/multisubunit Na+/H+ antiporter MnhA subunit
MLIVILSWLLVVNIAPIFLAKKYYLLTRILESLLCVVLAICLIDFTHVATYTWHVYTLNDLSFDFSIVWNRLNQLISIFILTIVFFVFRYAKNYQEYDRHRSRFIWQFFFVVSSVLLLVLANNLLTAFVAWQLIGLSFYLLLNHYQDEPMTRKMAQKKFISNRAGDIAFLAAVVLSYQGGVSDDFSHLSSSYYAYTICLLLLFSVLIKCAQFPFHRWLIATIQAPTPVSALMHAGVINAGGILLLKLSTVLGVFSGISYLLVILGFFSLLFSSSKIKTHADIKRKLTYSTMGQMGYMLMQFGLGAFSAALFHLVSHGFYKASLFLNSGESAFIKKDQKKDFLSITDIAKGFVIALIIFTPSFIFFKNHLSFLPILTLAFTLLTLVTLIVEARRSSTYSPAIFIFFTIGLAVIFYAYLFLVSTLSVWIFPHEAINIIAPSFQWLLAAIVYTGQVYFWLKPKNQNRSEFFNRKKKSHSIL